MNQRRAAVFLPLFVVVLVFFSRLVGCSTQTDDEGLPEADGGAVHVHGACGSPAEGCPCTAVGSTAACGQVDLTRDGFNQCSYGSFTCTAAGTWSACEGAIRVQSLLGKSQPHPHAQDQQLDASDCGDADPCDPYCSGYTDTPVGITPLPTGLTLADGGLTVIPAADGGVVPGTIQTTGNGLSACGPMLNAGTGGCSAFGPTACEQDFRCDVNSHTCVWNGGEGYHDNSLPGADLTIGTACSFGPTTTFPVCNRGSMPVPAGAQININFVPGNTAPTGCAAPSTPTMCMASAPAGGLTPGACLNVPCPIAGGGGFAVVNASDPLGLEAPGWCGNNVAYAATSDSADAGPSGCAACTYCETTLSGTVEDPGKNVGLRDVTVYELAGDDPTAVNAFHDPDGGSAPPPCDTCDSLLPSSLYSVATNTDNKGGFTLRDVTPGPNQTIVAQTGRWRRKVTMPIAACGNTVITNDDVLRMPKNQHEGDIPKIGFVMGAAESLECWMLKMGIDESEMTPWTGPGDTQRVQLFSQGGMSDDNGPLQSADVNLWATTGALNQYSAVVMSCDGEAFTAATLDDESGDPMNAIVNYANAGGRIFMDHWYGDTWLVDNGSPWNTSAVSTWQPGFDVALPFAGIPAFAKISNTTTPQQHMYDWLNQWASLPVPGPGFIVSQEPRDNSLDLGSASTEWLRGDADNFPATPPHHHHHHANGDYTLSFSFETPLGAATTCGRVLFNGMHASESRSPIDPFTGVVYGGFPHDCDKTSPLTPEETALEYQLFQVTACALGGRPPPPPPPPPPALASATFTRDFYGHCDPGLKLVWQAFNWDADIPVATSIQYYAATTDEAHYPAGLPATVTSAPATVPIGSGTMTTLAPQWGTDENTVDWHLKNEAPGPPQVSLDWLRVYMVFQPTATTAPTLYDWQQLYDCVPDQ